MYKIIEKLDKLLAELRPEYYSALNEPLNDFQINKLEEAYGVKIPGNLRALYKWKNGQNPDCVESFVNNSMFVSLEHALYIASELNEMIGSDFELENWWNEKWIPVFENGGGDSICCDLSGTFTGIEGQLIEFWHADNDRNVISPTLEAFLSKVIDFYETKDKDEFDEYFEVGNVDGYPIEFILE